MDPGEKLLLKHEFRYRVPLLFLLISSLFFLDGIAASLIALGLQIRQ
jgi:MFS-type transporter involved in bile tolerance (Atg22 family)